MWVAKQALCWLDPVVNCDSVPEEFVDVLEDVQDEAGVDDGDDEDEITGDFDDCIETLVGTDADAVAEFTSLPSGTIAVFTVWRPGEHVWDTDDVGRKLIVAVVVEMSCSEYLVSGVFWKYKQNKSLTFTS